MWRRSALNQEDPAESSAPRRWSSPTDDLRARIAPIPGWTKPRWSPRYVEFGRSSLCRDARGGDEGADDGRAQRRRPLNRVREGGPKSFFGASEGMEADEYVTVSDGLLRWC